MSATEREIEHGDEHQVTPLELFFDLVFVFAITQVTSLLTHDPTWGGVLRGTLVLAAIWWAWTGYAWLTSTLNVDEGGVRLVMLAAMGTMLGVALAVPGAFGDDAALFGFAFLVVRVLHLVLYANVARGDPDLLAALLRVVPTELLGAVLLVVAAFVGGDARIAIWMLALAIDYVGPAVVALRGWRIAPEHFAERHGLIVLIALGESIIAIGVGAGFDLGAGVISAAVLGIVVVSALWWLYFDVAAIFARRRLTQASGVEQARLAETRTATSTCRWSPASPCSPSASRRPSTTSASAPHRARRGALWRRGALPARAVAFLVRTTGRVFRRRTLGAIVLIALIPAALVIPALAALSLVAAVCSLVVAYEAIGRRESRYRIRHPEHAG